MKFGEKVRELRKERKMSQSELASRIGVTLRTVQSYEAGTSFPKKREMYARLADVLGCGRNYLMTESASFIQEAAERFSLRGIAQGRALVSEFRGLLSSGTLSAEEEEDLMKAMQDAYWTARKIRRGRGINE